MATVGHRAAGFGVESCRDRGWVPLRTRTPVSCGAHDTAWAMDSKVSNGTSPQDERTTSLLVFGFLQSYPHSRCHQELEVLGHKLAMRVAHDDELQTDGNWCSHFRDEGAAETDSETQEEVVRDIARQLAQIGDRMECSIRPGLVAGLAAQFRNTSLSEEERRRCLAAALEQLVQLCPADVDREKTLLLLTMLVAKKVADHSPALLQDVFHTTVTFINQNLLAYVRNLVQNLQAESQVHSPSRIWKTSSPNQDTGSTRLSSNNSEGQYGPKASQTSLPSSLLSWTLYLTTDFCIWDVIILMMTHQKFCAFMYEVLKKE
ncbi:BH3-interacting domain death agonist isoform X3 [Physeter macrocephalus]|uniref:BH3-interacting domain death agonist n=2 Tax=Physeter macrocephalus TaxID=9755 RepID=A0A455BD19_PHYMC|nr:BH3-interacting domain death agonist isoform X3 [Physeter catodon]|eukprot:XP_028346624.1 BH3-interacting domain death agonist isoform X2 [Physeter catodon]